MLFHVSLYAYKYCGWFDKIVKEWERGKKTKDLLHLYVHLGVYLNLDTKTNDT